jgi:hypothetical protein
MERRDWQQISLLQLLSRQAPACLLPLLLLLRSGMVLVE